MINLLKADILSLFIPGSAEELARTSASTGTSIPQLMLFGGVSYPHYIFLATMEVICLALIFWNALKWSDSE